MVKLYIGGQWVDREPDWRSQINLASCTRLQLYAAGLRDGYECAIGDLRRLPGMDDTVRLFVQHWTALDALDLLNP